MTVYGSGWVASSNLIGYWDHRTYKGWTIVRNNDGRFNILFDNRRLGTDFGSFGDALECGDIVISLLYPKPLATGEIAFNSDNTSLYVGKAVPDNRKEYIAFDCLNTVLGYFLARDNLEAKLIVMKRYPKATWFKQSNDYVKLYQLKGNKYVPAR